MLGGTAAFGEDFAGQCTFTYGRSWEIPIADEYVVIGGITRGVFANEAGDGSFLHNASVQCSSTWDADFGIGNFFGLGHCVFTDGDEDYAVLRWYRNSSKLADAHSWQEQSGWAWTHGTGKFKDIFGVGGRENAPLVREGPGLKSPVDAISGTWEVPH
jgi:hypothetical protein